jgi:uncharacterized protein with beta-barrel porin domain
MMNKAINQQDATQVDSLKLLKKRLTNYLTIGGIVLGTSFIGANTANSAEIVIDAGGQVDPSQTGTVNITTTTDAITFLDTEVLDTASGLATAASITSLGTTTAAATVLTISGAMGLVVTGDMTSGSGAAFTLNVDDGATNFLKIGGDISVVGSAAIDINLDGANASFMELNGGSAQAIGATILSDNGKDGLLKLTGAGKKTFGLAIGATLELAQITTAAATEAEFNAAADTVLLTNAGTTQFDAATLVTTVANTGTVKFNHTTAGVSGSTSITNTGTSATIDLNSAAARALTMIVIAADDGDGIMNIADSSADAAAAIQTISGVVGISGNALGAMNIGTATTNGSADLTLASFTNALTMTGGDNAAEDSILDLAVGMTTSTISMVRGVGGNKIALTGASPVLVGNITGSGAATTATNLNEIHVDSGGNTSTLTYAGVASGLDLIFVDVGDNLTYTGSSLASTNIELKTATAVLTLGNGAVDQTITGTIKATADNQGLIVNNNAANTVTIDGAVGADEVRMLKVTIADNSSTTFNNAVFSNNLDFNLNAAGEVVKFEAAGNFIGDFEANAGVMDLAGGEIQLGTAIVAGDTVLAATEVVDGAGGVIIATAGVTIVPAANFTSGTIVVIDTDTASMTSTEQGDIFVKDNVMTDFSVVTTTSDASIVATAKTSASIAKALSVTNNEATTLKEVMDAGDSTLVAALETAITTTGATAADLSEVKTILLQVAPQTDSIGGSSVATRAMTGTVQGIVSNRMASLRSGDAFVTGMSAGNGMSANSGFIQAFGSEGEQKNTSSAGATVFGFDAETSGLAIGFDGMTEDGSTIGLSASYSTTDVDGKGTGKSKNSIDSYTVSAYADKATENGYIEGSLTYGINDNTASRIVNTAGLNRAYSANYDSQQISLKIGGGVPQEVGDGTFVTPFMSATGTNINTDAFTEKSNVADDALRLRVEQDDINSLVGTLGIKAHMVTDKGTPMISLAVNNEFGDAQVNSQNTFQGGGAKFKTTTEVEELSATLGLGYSFGNDVTSLNINYEANVTDDDYMNQYGSIKIVAKF